MDLPEIVFKREIDVGHFLTFLTLLIGFAAAGYNAFIRRRKESEEKAKSGALRLMLAILREANGPMTLGELYAQFQSNEKAPLRRVYCEKAWKFTSRTQFEGAVYQLCWEMKADFVSNDSIEFRMKGEFTRFLSVSEDDLEKLISAAESSIRTEFPDRYLIRDIIDACCRVNVERTTHLIKRLLQDTDPHVVRTVSASLKEFVKEHKI